MTDCFFDEKERLIYFNFAFLYFYKNGRLMEFTGNIRKMKSILDSNGLVNYSLPLYDNLNQKEAVGLNELVNKEVNFRFNHQINCVVTGDSIKKVFGEGMSYKAFMNSPMASPSIIRPELSQIHEGIALRDEAWERANHLQPHYVYLSKTAGVKVGVTRTTQIPTRWIDQGATEGIVLAEVPYRQLAGLIEVELKQHMSDKTNWRNMLKNMPCEENMVEKKEAALELLPEEYHEFIFDDDSITTIEYPVLKYPSKVTSLKFEKLPEFTKTLIGIKGQYLLFSDDTVINMRSHAGFQITLSY